MKFILLASILFSLPLMAMKTQGKHYRLTEEEAGTKWRYYFKQNLSSGLSTNKIILDKCFNMHVETGEKVEIPCLEMDKIKSTLDLREISETEKSVSAI